MAQGGGKYEDLCYTVRLAAEAQGAVVIVIDGNQGNGFSVQVSPEVLAMLPNILRLMADQIAADILAS